MAGGGAPGGLPLICRFSRTPGWQPVAGKMGGFTCPVSPFLQTGTLILVIPAYKPGSCAIFPETECCRAPPAYCNGEIIPYFWTAPAPGARKCWRCGLRFFQAHAWKNRKPQLNLQTF